MSSIPFLFHLPPDFPIPRGTEPAPKSSAVPSLFGPRPARRARPTPRVADRGRDQRRRARPLSLLPSAPPQSAPRPHQLGAPLPHPLALQGSPTAARAPAVPSPRPPRRAHRRPNPLACALLHPSRSSAAATSCARARARTRTRRQPVRVTPRPTAVDAAQQRRPRHRAACSGRRLAVVSLRLAAPFPRPVDAPPVPPPRAVPSHHHGEPRRAINAADKPAPPATTLLPPPPLWPSIKEAAGHPPSTPATQATSTATPNSLPSPAAPPPHTHPRCRRRSPRSRPLTPPQLEPRWGIEPLHPPPPFPLLPGRSRALARRRRTPPCAAHLSPVSSSGRKGKGSFALSPLPFPLISKETPTF